MEIRDLNRLTVVLAGQKRTNKWLAEELSHCHICHVWHLAVMTTCRNNHILQKYPFPQGLRNKKRLIYKEFVVSLHY